MIYDPERVFAAVSSQAFDQTGRLRSWTEFPLEFAIGVFRDFNRARQIRQLLLNRCDKLSVR
jgi:hypothetical protein